MAGSRSLLDVGRRVVDTALEVPVVTSFTRLGPDVRRRVAGWRPLDEYDLTGRTVMVTGVTSGLGLATVRQLARCGATLVLLGRDRARTEAVARELPGGSHRIVVADMGDLAQVRAAASQVMEHHSRLDALVHNAGALTADRRENSDGIEQTVASQVLGPFLLTSLLLPALRTTSPSGPGRVVTVSSGGMYAASLHVRRLQMGGEDDPYKGAEQYARAKRAQVTLSEMWALHIPRSEVVFHSMHPGWADTPGVASSLPRFRSVVGPLLRTPEQGADTIVWLVADDGPPLARSGQFWLDRRERPIHRLPATRRSDTTTRRLALWDWVVATTGATPPAH